MTAGTSLTSSYITRLQAKGYRFLYIEDDFSAGIEPDDVLDEMTQARALATLQDGLMDLAEKRPLDSSRVTGVVEEIADSVNSRKSVAVGIASIRNLDEYTFVHSLNVCVLSLIIGAENSLNRYDLIDLGVGALLHDVGKVVVPVEVLNKPGQLTNEEMEIVKIHATEGFEILRVQPGISLLSAHVAYQHHERMNGLGYPRGLQGSEIHRFARMTSVTDIMDALTAERPYRDALPPHRAGPYLLSLAGDHLDPGYVRSLLARLAMFPSGTPVRLSTGQVGIVSRQSYSDPARPIVIVLTDDRLGPVRPYEVEMDRRPDLDIVEVLHDLPELTANGGGHAGPGDTAASSPRG
ncbi:MAG: HD-GYP domain-containing protein [Firmicutes bacterium]|nr:HD-GYP domain-containing protein [Bacillota bacterium]